MSTIDLCPNTDIINRIEYLAERRLGDAASLRAIAESSLFVVDIGPLCDNLHASKTNLFDPETCHKFRGVLEYVARRSEVSKPRCPLWLLPSACPQTLVLISKANQDFGSVAQQGSRIERHARSAWRPKAAYR